MFLRLKKDEDEFELEEEDFDEEFFEDEEMIVVKFVEEKRKREVVECREKVY